MTVSIDGTLGITAPQFVITNGTSTVTLLPPASGTQTGTPVFQSSTGGLTLTNSTGGSLVLSPAAGSTTATNLAFPNGIGTLGQVLTSDGAGSLTWGAGGGLTIGTTAIGSGTTGSILINTSNVLQQLVMGAGVSNALSNAAGGANGLATLNASGILPTSQGGTGNASPAGTVAAGSATQTGTMTLYNSGAGANPLSIQSAVNTVPWTLTLPTNGGTNGQVLATNGSGTTSWVTPAVVAGANTQVMYNSSGALAGAAGFTFDGVSSVTLGVGSTSSGKIVLNNSTNTNTLTLQAGATAASQTFTLPTTTGASGDYLTTNGSGVLAWIAPAASAATNGNFDVGTPSGTTGNLNLYSSSSADGVTIASGNNTTPWTLTLPTDPGTTGQVMYTDGSGNMSWVSSDITLGTTTVALGGTAATLGGLDMVTVSALGYTPVNAGDLTSKQYVDALFSAVNNNIGAVSAATTAAINLTGLQTIDGVTLIAGDRVLVKDGSIANGHADDGVYVVAAGGWSYASDANTWNEYVGALVFVDAGTTYANTSWLQTVGVGGTLGTTPMDWAQINSPLNYSGGPGIQVVGNVINNTGVVSIATGTTGLTYTVGVGGVTTVTGALSIANGGTGQSTAQTALDALLPAQGPNNGKVLTTDGTNASWGAPTASSAAGGTFNVGTGPGVTGTLSLYNAANANGVSIRSGVNSAAWTLTLPQNGGTNGQVLQTDGSGATTWTTLVNSGTAGQLAWYSATGTSVSGNANVTVSSGALTVGVTGTQAGSLVVAGGTTGAVTVQAANAAGTWSLTLPTSGGTNGQVLTTNGSGVTSWTAPAASSATGGTFSVGTASSTTGSLDLYNASSAFGVSVKSGNNSPAAWSLTLPTGPGTAGQVLQTDGNGVTTWTTPSSGLTIGTTSITGGTSGRILYNNANKVEEKAVTGTGDVVLKSGPEITSLRETKTNGSISGGALAIDCALGNVLAVPLNANITSVTFSNIPATGSAYSIILSFTADGTARTITWPASVRWPNGTAPTMTSTNNKVDTIVLYTYDGGTNWFGFISGQNA